MTRLIAMLGLIALGAVSLPACGAGRVPCSCVKPDPLKAPPAPDADPEREPAAPEQSHG